MRRSCQFLLLSVTFLSVHLALARLPAPVGSEDIQSLSLTASFIFHGKVVDITPERGFGKSRIATFEVDRWYKGASRQTSVYLQFQYPGTLIGHDCIDLSRSSSWLIFAKENPLGVFQFSDDCEGGLPVSSILAPLRSNSWLQQLQDDLVAGLQDSNPEFRLDNIQRLGALKQRSSSYALREFIEHGSESEIQWATFAMLRSGDINVLPQVKQIALNQEDIRICSWSPDACDTASTLITQALGNLQDPKAAPMLRAILESSHSESYKRSAARALADIKDPLSVPILAKYLGDPNVRFHSLVGMEKNLGVPNCTLRDGWKDEDIEPQALLCKEWWDTEGKQKWSAPKHQQ
jgi:hypothetical protein